MKFHRKLIVIAVSTTMLMTLASCDQITSISEDYKSHIDNKKNGGEENDLIELVDNYSKALISCNGKKILKLSDKDFAEDFSSLEDDLDFASSYDSDISDILTAIADSMDYTYQEDSLKINNDDAEAEVLITFADYKGFLVDDEATTDAETFIDAISSAKVTQKDSIMLTIDMSKIDDEWVVVNSDEIVKEVYEFTDFDYTFLTLDPATKANLTVASAGFYAYETNVEKITVELAFTEDSDENHDVYYTVFYGDEEVYNSDLVDGDKELVYGKDQNAELTDEGYLLPGDYGFVIFNSDNVKIYSVPISVEVDESAEPTETDSTDSSVSATPPTPSTDANEIIPSDKGQLDVKANGFSEDSEVYAAPVDYAKSFSKDFNIGDMYVGNLYMPIYIVLDGDNSAIIIDTVTFMDNLYIFAENNFDALLTNSFGISIEEYAEMTNISVEEAREALMDAMFSGMDSSREEDGEMEIEIIGVTYEIDGDTINLTNKVGGKVTTAQYKGDSIILSAEELDAVEDLDDSSITFEKVS